MEILKIDKLISFIKRIERNVYPEYMQYLQDYNSLDEIADYCEAWHSENQQYSYQKKGDYAYLQYGELYIYFGEGWYMLSAQKGANLEVCDFAKRNTCKAAPIFMLWREHISHFCKVEMDCKADTSYRFIKFLERREMCKVEIDNKYFWEDTEMHKIVISVNHDRKNNINK